MSTSIVKYEGALRTTSTHIFSGSQIVSDAPTDNMGKGEAFSPTDLTANSLAQCILTTIGIVAQRDGHPPIDGTVATVTKIMYSEPRRIGEIHVEIKFAGGPFTEKDIQRYENTAHTCPVAKSLHPDIKQVLTFIWP